MVIFNSYVKLPEGNPIHVFWGCLHLWSQTVADWNVARTSPKSMGDFPWPFFDCWRVNDQICFHCLLGGELPTNRKWVYNPSYKWINLTYPMSITGVITHLRFVGSSPPSTGGKCLGRLDACSSHRRSIEGDNGTKLLFWDFLRWGTHNLQCTAYIYIYIYVYIYAHIYIYIYIYIWLFAFVIYAFRLSARFYDSRDWNAEYFLGPPVTIIMFGDLGLWSRDTWRISYIPVLLLHRMFGR